MTELRAEALVADACAATGLDDFGTDSFRDGLDGALRFAELGRTAQRAR